MDERLPQTIAEAFACKFPEWNAEKCTRRGESCKSVDIEDVDDLKIFTDAELEKLDVSETVRSALRAVKADLVSPASSPSKHSAVSFDEDVSTLATKKPRLIDPPTVPSKLTKKALLSSKKQPGKKFLFRELDQNKKLQRW